MITIFGYGSLININSVANTLGRKPILTPAILNDYYRTWTAPSDIIIDGKKEKGLFLDLTQYDGAFCNGVIFDVYDHELEYLDCRECGYIKGNVFVNSTIGDSISAITYIVDAPAKNRGGKVPTKYKSLIEEGVSHYNKSFKQTFQVSTERYSGEYIKGSYTFPR